MENTLTLETLIQKLESAIDVFPSLNGLQTPMFIAKVNVEFDFAFTAEESLTQTWQVVPWDSTEFNNIQFFSSRRDDDITPIEHLTVEHIIKTLRGLLPFDGTISHDKGTTGDFILLHPENPLVARDVLTFHFHPCCLWKRTKLVSKWHNLINAIHSLDEMFKKIGSVGDSADDLLPFACLIQRYLELGRSQYPKKVEVYLISTRDGPKVFLRGSKLVSELEYQYQNITRLDRTRSLTKLCKPIPEYPMIHTFPSGTVKELITKLDSLREEYAQLF